ncbi:hypothetical protein [Flavobacterium nitrogenifigens]|uniref:Uncharacterized protein n=1 Tax=Flavobacterium nitrogenifigens TaxID=1617283 RepID=A0A521AM03_9FLAO|nr:hypothetical protein [Flavobacterium nitrogenifigens]KAF2339080.1 hypothetical protein DM397_01925 [Flavobacterium nitrogenifigens]SMO35823.1 hypothetical protein SAMN06265220_101275 [Flavobacterium nitrogenifigens]
MKSLTCCLFLILIFSCNQKEQTETNLTVETEIPEIKEKEEITLNNFKEL